MRRGIVALAIGIPVTLALIVGAGYVHDEVTAGHRVSRGVLIAGVDASRLTINDASGIVASYEATLLAQPVVLIIEGTPVELDPKDVSLDIDERAVAEAALTIRRKDSIASNFAAWFRSFTSTASIDIPVSMDDAAIAAILEELSLAAINRPAYDGAVEVRNGSPVPQYPQPGIRIDVESTIPLIREQLARTDRQPVDVPLISISPHISSGDVDTAVAQAKKLIESPVVLRSPDQSGTIVFTPAGLASALQSEIVVNSPATLQVSLDAETLIKIAARSASQFVIPPTDATFAFNENTRTLEIVPSIRGQKVDLEAIPDAVIAAGLRSEQGTIPMTEGAEASFTTEEAEAMGPLGEVSSFTTNYPCCQSRVTNIQLLADEIRGAIVMPGEEFSVNKRAGERTLEEGYVRAGAIINGRIQCCDSKINIGGGTSQFATTFYNAVFFGCYEDVFHQPHSLYFSRYPFVREATLGWPMPDVIFRNDSDAVVYIDTTYTPTSITVTFFGNNGGRVCTSERDGNTITRVMTYPDGSVTQQHWTWRYRKPKPKDDPVEHPDTTTTTTTLPPTTTTTLPPTTTTTLPPTTTTTTP